MSDGNIGHNKTEIDILSRRGMLKNIIRFSTPIMLTGVLQLFFNDCDIIVCRYFGSGNAVGAISSTDALINLIVMLFMGMSVGANILMAKCVGSNNKEQGQKMFILLQLSQPLLDLPSV